MIERTDKINLKYLPKYGITEEIIRDLIKYDIMPPVDKRTKANGKVDYFVNKSDVILLLTQMLKNQMEMYKVVEEVHEKAEEAKKLLDEAPEVK